MSDGEEDSSKDLLDIEVFSMFLEVQTKLKLVSLLLTRSTLKLCLINIEWDIRIFDEIDVNDFSVKKMVTFNCHISIRWLADFSPYKQSRKLWE